MKAIARGVSLQFIRDHLSPKSGIRVGAAQGSEESGEPEAPDETSRVQDVAAPLDTTLPNNFQASL